MITCGTSAPEKLMKMGRAFQFMAEQGYTRDLDRVLTTNRIIEHCLLPSFVRLKYRKQFIRYTRLHAAAFIGNVERVRKLIDSGADLEATTITGYTPLTFAIMQKHYDVAELLLERGANPRGYEKSPDPPIFWACRRHDHDLLTLLRQYNVDLDSPFTKWAPATPVTYAVERGDQTLLHMLLKEGCDPNRPDGNGGTPLWYAKNANISRVVRLLEEYGATSVEPPEQERRRIEERERRAALEKEKEEAKKRKLSASALSTPEASDYEEEDETARGGAYDAKGTGDDKRRKPRAKAREPGNPCPAANINAMSRMAMREEAARLGLIRLSKEDLAAQRARHNAAIAASATAKKESYRNMNKKKNLPKILTATADKKRRKETRR